MHLRPQDRGTKGHRRAQSRTHTVGREVWWGGEEGKGVLDAQRDLSRKQTNKTKRKISLHLEIGPAACFHLCPSTHTRDAHARKHTGEMSLRHISRG